MDACVKSAMDYFKQPIFKFGELLVFLAFAYHAANGIRLVLVELGYGLGKPARPVYPYGNSVARQRPNVLVRYVPIVGWLPQYEKSWLVADLLAGLSVWALVVPQALGYASVVGVPAQYGLYTQPADNDVVAGINRMLSWMIASKTSLTAGHALPRGLVLPKSLVPRTIKQYQGYRWADNEKKDGSAKHRELVYKKNDDLCDSDRYALMLYPELPPSAPTGVQAGKRDLSALPDYVRAQVERVRRIDSADGAEPGDDVPLALEYMGDEYSGIGMGDFSS
jgi:hypothetical protein